MAANGSRRRNHGWKKHGTGEYQGTEGERDGRGKERTKGRTKRGPGVDTTKRQKRRLDYTSPAARSLFGRNRFFITKSLAGLYIKLYIRHSATLVKLTGIPWTHRVPRDRGVAHNWSSPVHTSRARAAYNFRRTRDKSMLGPRVPYTSNLQLAKMDCVSELMRGKSTYRLTLVKLMHPTRGFSPDPLSRVSDARLCISRESFVKI